LNAQQTKTRQDARSARSRATPTHRDVKYGPFERNVMDVWLVKSRGLSPMLVSIHGGGFQSGNKSVDARLLQQCLDAGVSVAAITYRLSNEAKAPAQFLDAARAVQYIRHRAQEWNVDTKRIAATGSSAGAGISLWLGFHDDLADPDSQDPVLRESTRLACMTVFNGQTSYDPRFIRDLFPGTNTHLVSALARLFDVDLNKLDELSDEKYRLFERVSPLHHVTEGDAPAQLIYANQLDTAVTSQGIGIHHPRFGKVLQEKMIQLGIECEVQTGVARGSDQWAKLVMGFVQKHLAEE
jgi:acetyl esterase/lipase